MGTYATIIYEKKDKVAWITLNRPKVLNAINLVLTHELLEALEDSRCDERIHTIVITGAGERAFSAGADINEFRELSVASRIGDKGRIRPHYLIREIAKPVIAMVNGLALGGGFELVLACDIAIASSGAQFGLPEVRVGVIPGAGGTQVLTRLIGDKKAKELILTGQPISAEEALKLGVVNQVVAPDKLKETVEAFIDLLKNNGPLALGLAKIAINKAQETTLSTGLSYESDLFTICIAAEDAKEAATAFLEKRPQA